MTRSFVVNLKNVLRAYLRIGSKARNEDSMGFQGGGFGGPREMHKAICAECKKECDVPFKPSGDRPVYCKDCFSKRKGSSNR